MALHLGHWLLNKKLLLGTDQRLQIKEAAAHRAHLE